MALSVGPDSEHQYHDGNARLGLNESPAIGSTMELNELNLIADDIVSNEVQLMSSWRGMKMSQKRCESSLELLQLAEELEKKQALTGLHWEAGAAALPMRRGSDVLGYFDVDAHNFITQTISSEAFRRDHGSAQVLAVHFNYIAIGMSRGAIVVVSSKYTPHHADPLSLASYNITPT